MITKEQLFEDLKHCCLEEPLHNMNFEDQIHPIISKYGDDIFTAHGVSRGVIVPTNADFVIKIPFSHTIDEDSSWETWEEVVEYYGSAESAMQYEFWQDDDGYYYPTCPMQLGDYCKMEVDIYHHAQTEGLEEVFAAEEKLGEVNNFSIYAQVKAESFEYYSSSSVNSTDPQKLEKAKTIIDSYQNDKGEYIFNKTWLADVLIAFGTEYLERLFNFLSEEGICDLHHGNLGYIDTIPVIFDNASFNG